jgi:hypothetical protein
MTILEHIQISNFRGFDILEIDGFSKINLFVGKNNSGKTSILEALFLIFGMSNPVLPININQFRGLNAGTVKQLKYLFHNLNMENKPRFSATFNDVSERCLELSAKYRPNGFSVNNSSTSIPEIIGLDLNFFDMVNVSELIPVNIRKKDKYYDFVYPKYTGCRKIRE